MIGGVPCLHENMPYVKPYFEYSFLQAFSSSRISLALADVSVSSSKLFSGIKRRGLSRRKVSTGILGCFKA